VGTPWEVYARPATLFVASFVGAMNVITDLPVGPGGALALGAASRPVPALAGRDRVTLAIRLEDMTVGGPDDDVPTDALALDGVVDKVTFAGREAFYRVQLQDGPQVLAHVHRPEHRQLEQAGARVRLIMPLAHVHWFDPVTERRIGAVT
jgi:sn-glycerol 3-phosphate transport system ATP-binding protein